MMISSVKSAINWRNIKDFNTQCGSILIANIDNKIIGIAKVGSEEDKYWLENSDFTHWAALEDIEL